MNLHVNLPPYRNVGSLSGTTILIGTAGWSLPRDMQQHFPSTGSHLTRYATQLAMTEINSSFSRRHRVATYERWADTTPDGFRFSVKVPRTITHVQRLAAAVSQLEEFLADISGLGEKLGCILVQMPPSLAFEATVFSRFANELRCRYHGFVAVEARHASWFGSEVDHTLAGWRMARVLADPVLHAAGVLPGGWPGLAYLRLHGSPRTYWSSYQADVLKALAQRILLAAASGQSCWCVFDNTAGGAALANALDLQQRLRKELCTLANWQLPPKSVGARQS